MASTQSGDVRELAARMAAIARRYRRTHPLSELAQEAGVYYLPTGTPGSPHLKPLVWFPSRGCVWSLAGGCTMCNFGTTTHALDDDAVLRAWEQVLDTIGTGVQRIHIGPGGSFFTDAEVPAHIRIEVIRRLHRLPFLRSVGIETRAPFVTFERLDDVVRALPSTVENVTLGFGLECISDLPRLACVNKGYGPEDIEEALEIMRAVERRHPSVRIHFETYTLLKPIFLTEGEAVAEALSTLEWAFERGVETAVLFLNTVKEHTIQHELYLADTLEPPIRFEPPFCRSAVEVLLQLPDEWRRNTVVLGPQSAVAAEGMPRACELCSWPINGALVAHNLYRAPAILHAVAATVCPCKTEWEAELDAPSEPLANRIARGLDALDALL